MSRPRTRLLENGLKTPRVVAAAALNVVFSGIVLLRLRPTCLPLTILGAAISLTMILARSLFSSFQYALVFPPSCGNFRAVIGAGLSTLSAAADTE